MKMSALIGLFLWGMALFTVNGLAQTSISFDYTGEVETYTVPNCVAQLEFVIKGAKGGGANGGNGSTVSGILDVVEGEILEIRVGGTGGCPSAGFNGGGEGGNSSGANAGCGGGGASDIRVGGSTAADRVVVASGGGGMGGGNTDANAGAGGCSSGLEGESPFGQGGNGATQNAGGLGGPPWIGSGNNGSAGSLANGGAGAIDPCYNVGPGGGGGGGYYGGGGGGSDCFASGTLGGGGGGGGSSLTPAGFTCVGGNVTGAGSITITPYRWGGHGHRTYEPTILRGRLASLDALGSRKLRLVRSRWTQRSRWSNRVGQPSRNHRLQRDRIQRKVH